MDNKQYKVIKLRGLLSTNRQEYVGTLEELCKELRMYLDGTTCRKPESLERKLNASQRGKEGTYCYSSFYVEEI